MTFAALIESVDRAALAHLGGVAITYRTGAGVSREVTGLFDEVGLSVNVGTPGVESTGPAAFLRLSDLPSDPRTDSPTLTVGAASYTVWKREPDGLGGILLRLHSTT